MSPLRKPIALYTNTVDRATAWLEKRGWGRALIESFRAYDEHGCAYMTSALSFYAIVSLIPLAFIAIWILTVLIGSSAAAQTALASMLNQFLLPQAADALMRQAELLYTRKIETLFGAWWGIIAFLWSGVRFYGLLHVVLTRAWGGGTTRSFLHRQAWTIMAFVVAGMFFGLTMLISASATALVRMEETIPGIKLAWLDSALLWVLPWLFTICMVYLLYKYMPTAYVPTRLAIGAAIPVGIIWEATKRIFASLVVGTDFYSSIYGPMAGFVLLMVWIYLSSVIVLYGAEYAAAWEKEYYLENGESASGQLPQAAGQQP